MKRIAIAALGLMVAACGIFGKDNEVEPLKPNPLPDIEQQAGLDRVWSFDLGGDHTGLRPALSGNSVFIASAGGRVAGVNLESGSVLWRKQVDMTVTGGTGSGDGLVLLGGLDGEVVALDQGSGAEAWRTRVDSEVLAPPRAGSGTVVVRTIDGAVTGLSSASGEPLWKLRRDVPSLTLRGSGPPLVEQGVAVMGFADGKLVALDVRNGGVLWEITVSRPSGTNEVERMIDVDATPVRVGNALYSVSFQGNVRAYALNPGQTMWTREASSHTDISVDDNNIYVSDSSGRILAFDRLSGEQAWEQDRLLRRRLSGPAAVDGYVLVGDYEGYLHLLDAADGRLIGRRDLGDRVSAQPLVSGGRLVAVTEDGKLRAYTVRAGGG